MAITLSSRENPHLLENAEAASALVIYQVQNSSILLFMGIVCYNAAQYVAKKHSIVISHCKQNNENLAKQFAIIIIFLMLQVSFVGIILISLLLNFINIYVGSYCGHVDPFFIFIFVFEELVEAEHLQVKIKNKIFQSLPDGGHQLAILLLNCIIIIIMNIFYVQYCKINFVFKIIKRVFLTTNNIL
eukprot:TRINITY_DN16481_c0_g1_i7.p1 TRINITY_DN16481_c0_g1~~TRINITY_DN16481_c0_g1_i7.p1  ORF type:complete len:187 (-),score=-2.92 TRINITY_DN16481_c0_g1_i7:30-590(-)